MARLLQEFESQKSPAAQAGTRQAQHIPSKSLSCVAQPDVQSSKDFGWKLQKRAGSFCGVDAKAEGLVQRIGHALKLCQEVTCDYS